MFDLVRKHTKVLMFLMFLLIIPAFVLVGVDGYNQFSNSDPKVASVAGRDVRQWLHRRRTRRCASTASSESAKLNGSMPMSSRRVTVSGALFVCSVDSTRWPVSAALTAISAVS